MMSVYQPDSAWPVPSPDRRLEDIVPGRIDPDAVETAVLRQGLALWRGLAGARAYPARHQMSPRAMGALLRNTILIKVLDDGAEFQVRVIGDAILAVQTEPLQGLTTRQIDEVLPGYGDGLRAMYGHVCAYKEPVAFRGSFRRQADGRDFHREHLLLPLGESDAAVDHLMSLVVHTRPGL